jgi:hypothetical protein
MFKFRTLLLVIVLVFTLSFIKDRACKISGQLNSFSEEEKNLLAEIEKGVGEKMTYDVRLGSISLGRSTFSHMPSVELNGKRLIVMVFETSLAQFKDIETIYTDPQTFLPVKVEREVLNWFTREKITEDYNQRDFTVTINKKRGSKTETLVIKKDSPIQNAILLPQGIRRSAKLDANETLVANLPTSRYEIKLASIEEIKVPAGTFKAYHFKSTPSQIEIWISADERKIPVKIQSNNIAFGYIMVLKEYNSGH